MNTINMFGKKVMLGAAGMILLASFASAATVTQTVDDIDWNAAMWGYPEASPTADNDYVSATGTVRFCASGASGEFEGNSLTIVTGSKALIKLNNGNTATVNGDIIMDGGLLTLGPNANSHATLDLTQLVLQSNSEIGCANVGLTLTIDGTLTGTGDITVVHDAGTAGGTRKVVFNAISNYTGSINVTEGMDIGFGSDYTFTAPLTLSDGSVLTVDHTLTFGALKTNGTAIAAGTYSGTNEIAALGANFTGDGTLIVSNPSKYVTEVLSQNPQGYWSLDEPSGSGTAYARAGTDATLSSGVAAGDDSLPRLNESPGFFEDNTAYSFDGTVNASLSLDRSLMTSSNGSVSFWFRKDSTQDANAMQIMWYASRVEGGNGGGEEDEMHVGILNNGNVELFIEGYGGNSDLNLSTSGSYNDDIWHHVAATWSASATALYLDGGSSLRGETITGAASPASWAFDAKHRFGRPDSLREYEGKADELAVWNTAITADQVESQFLSTIEQGLIFIVK